MSVGVLLLTHEGIGHSLVAAAQRILRVLNFKVAVHEVPWDGCDCDAESRTFRQELRELDEGQGVLVLTDLFGATPCNLVASNEPGRLLIRVAGVNLPMLLRVLTHPESQLPELAALACEGGRSGVVLDA